MRTPPCASGEMCPIRTTPAHDPASVVGHGDRKGREERMNTGTGAGSQAGENKKARADAHRSPVRADSCLSGFWSMPCDSIPAAPSQRFLHSAAFPQRPGLAGPHAPPAAESPPRSPVGKKSRTEGGAAVFPAAAKTSTGRGEGARNPAGAGLSFRAPKRPPVSLAISAAEAACFCSFPPQSYGCGSGGTGSGGCPDP